MRMQESASGDGTKMAAVEDRPTATASRKVLRGFWR
jgi:hypothetical protein